MRVRSRRRVIYAFLLATVLFEVVETAVGKSHTVGKRPVTVADSIAMSLVGDPSYQIDGREPAIFSPDGQSFVVVTRKGNIERNTIDYSLLLFRSGEIWSHPRPQTLATFASGSNRPGIAGVRWIDNRRIGFLGENRGELQQLYVIRADNRKLQKITTHSTAIVTFGLSTNGRTVVFLAHPPIRPFFDEESLKYGLLFGTQQLSDVMIGSTSDKESGLLYPLQLFVQRKGHVITRIDLGENKPEAWSGVSVSPDGEYAVIRVALANFPDSWKRYKQSGVPVVKDDAWVEQYLLVNCLTARVRPLINAPTRDWAQAVAWSGDSKRVLVADTFLPLDVADEKKNQLREERSFLAAVDVKTGKVKEIGSDEFDRVESDPAEHGIRLYRKAGANGSGAKDFQFYREMGDTWSPLPRQQVGVSESIEIKQEEGMNAPPRLFARKAGSDEEKMILDLNPQFADLAFGHVEEITWNTRNGQAVKGGLYFPPDYNPKKRYPLVIQTHGWNSTKFWIDGYATSGYAAQALAGNGFLVAQVPDSKFTIDVREVPAAVALYEGLIDSLDKQGLIDREKVGILGFSRTGFYVRYMLAFSKYPIKAAIIEDGGDGGYVDYMSWVNMGTQYVKAYEDFNGGMPFGDGLKKWFENSPSFHLDNVGAPVLLMAFRPYSLLEEWDWFAGLKRLGRPVELVWFKDAEHAPIKPSERMTAQQGAVDWFSFWIQGVEDPDPAKLEQYERWRKLRSESADQISDGSN